MASNRMQILVGVDGTERSVSDLGRIARGTREVGTDAEAAGRRAEKSMGIIRGSLRQAAGAVGPFAAAFGFRDTIKSGMDLQVQQAAIRQSLGRTGDAGEDAFERVMRASERASERGGFSTEDNLKAINSFLHQTDSTTKSLQAFSAATDLARARGIGLSKAQQIVLRSLTGSTVGVSRYVHGLVPVKTAEEDLIRSRKASADQWEATASRMNKASAGSGTQWLRQMELSHGVTQAQLQQAKAADRNATAQRAVALILDQYGGQQSRYARTTQGRLESMGNAFKNVEANIGQAFLPAVSRGAAALEVAARWLDRNRWAAYALVGVVGALGVDALGKRLVGGARDGAKAVKAVGSAMEWAAGRAIALASGDTAAAASTVEVGAAGDAAAGQLALFDVAADATAVSLGAVVLEAAVLTGGLVLLGAGVLAVVRYHRQLGAAAVRTWHWIEGAAESAWAWIKGHWPLVGLIVAGPFGLAAGEVVAHWRSIARWGQRTWASVKNGAADAVAFIRREFTGLFDWLKRHTVDPLAHVGGGVGGALSGAWRHTFGGLSTGGVVRDHEPADAPVAQRVKHLYTGGPAGTDTVEGWLTPGEGVLNRAGMAAIGGELGLSRINQGAGSGQPPVVVQIEPTPVSLQIDGKTLARATVHYTLKKAARGPSSLVGGSLVTGSA